MALNIAFGGGQGPKFEGVDIGGSVALPAPLYSINPNMAGITIGPLIFYDPTAVDGDPGSTPPPTRNRPADDPQMELLDAPESRLTYTAPRPHYDDLISHELEHVRQFEALGPALLLAYALGGGREFEDYRGDGTMWQPGPEMARQPVFRYTPERGLQFMPAWRFNKHKGGS